jgi:hypothetical protein
VGERYGAAQVPFSVVWVGTWIGVSLIVLIAAIGLAAILTGENISRALSPLWMVIRQLFLGVAWLLGWIAEALVLLLRLLVRDIDLKRFRETLSILKPGQVVFSDAEQPLTGEGIVLRRTLQVVAGVLVLVVLVALSLRRLRQRDEEGAREEVESVWDPALARGALRELWGGVRDRWARVVSSMGGSSALMAQTVRRIYAQMAAQAGESGYPRVCFQTPYEYLVTLQRVFPEAGADLERITAAYVVVHYGEVFESRDELNQVQAAWQRVSEVLK